MGPILKNIHPHPQNLRGLTSGTLIVQCNVMFATTHTHTRECASAHAMYAAQRAAEGWTATAADAISKHEALRAVLQRRGPHQPRSGGLCL